MSLRLLDYLTEPGSTLAANEDLVGKSKKRYAAWVLDGATGLGNRRILPGLTDAAWLVNQYHKEMKVQLSQQELKDVVRGSIEKVAAKFALKMRIQGEVERFELPSAGMAIIRSTKNGAEFSSLGDCQAIIELPDGTVERTEPTRLAQFDAEVIAELENLRRNHGLNFDQALASVRPRLRDNRAKLNTPEGYWVLSIHPEAAGTMVVKTLHLEPGTQARGLLVSDGYYRLVDFKICRNDLELIQKTFAEGPAEMIRQLRAEEEKDRDCEKFHRLKRMDDASVFLFEIYA